MAKKTAPAPEIKKDVFKNGKTLQEYWEPGFLFPALLLLDSKIGTKRWAWWGAAMMNGELPLEPYEPVGWVEAGNPHVRRVVDKLVSCVTFCHTEDFLDFMLYGFGDKSRTGWMKERHETIKHWESTLHDVFPTLIERPFPYFSAFLEEVAGKYWRQGTGFFCTPMSLSILMARLNYGDSKDITQSVYDCACGTGNLLLAASDYSVNLYGQDISATVLRGLFIHGFLYAPWLVKPFPQAMFDKYHERKDFMERMTVMLGAMRKLCDEQKADDADEAFGADLDELGKILGAQQNEAAATTTAQ